MWVIKLSSFLNMHSSHSYSSSSNKTTQPNPRGQLAKQIVGHHCHPLPNKDHILDVMKVISTISYNKLPSQQSLQWNLWKCGSQQTWTDPEDMELEPRRCADARKSNGQLLTVMTCMSSMSISWLWYLCGFSGFSHLSYMSIIQQHTNSLDPQPAWTICSWTCQPSVSRCYCGRCIQTNVTGLGSTCFCCICQTSPNPCCPCLH